MSFFIDQLYHAAQKMATAGANLASVASKRHVIRKVLPVHPQHLFNIIVQVDSYSSFLPLCTYSRVIRSSPCKTQFDAILKVGITGLPPPLISVEEEYTSRVETKHYRTVDGRSGKDSFLYIVDATSIQSKYIDSLKSQWRLRPIEPIVTRPMLMNPLESSSRHQQLWTDVDFSIEMSISDPILAVLLDQILKDVASRQVLAFEKRCLQVPFELETSNPSIQAKT